MRKARIIAMVMLASMMAAVSAYSQSQIAFGDKSIREQKRIIRVIRGQVDEYRLSIKQITKYNTNHLTKEDSASISNYNKKIDYLENQLDNLIAAMAGKDAKYNANLENRDPRKVAEAYLLMKYADNLGNKKESASSEGSDSAKLKGIVVNNWFREVGVQIVGPGNFFLEFSLKPNEKSPVFSLPIIGEYTAVFICGNERKSVTKQVKPNVLYYDGSVAYDFKATLPAY